MVTEQGATPMLWGSPLATGDELENSGSWGGDGMTGIDAPRLENEPSTTPPLGQGEPVPYGTKSVVGTLPTAGLSGMNGAEPPRKGNEFGTNAAGVWTGVNGMDPLRTECAQKTRRSPGQGGMHAPRKDSELRATAATGTFGLTGFDLLLSRHKMLESAEVRGRGKSGPTAPHRREPERGAGGRPGLVGTDPPVLVNKLGASKKGGADGMSGTNAPRSESERSTSPSPRPGGTGLPRLESVLRAGGAGRPGAAEPAERPTAAEAQSILNKKVSLLFNKYADSELRLV